MSEPATDGKARRTTNSRKQAGAFTFVEVLVALAIASISLLTLLRLHLLSMRMVDRAKITTQAVLLAEEKVAETLAGGYPDLASKSGTVEKNGLRLNWRAEVADLQLPQLGETHVAGLRRIVVDVNWKQGAARKQLQMSTYVADGKL